MADFSIDVGFDTKGFNNVGSGVGNVDSGAGRGRVEEEQKRGISSGFITALKATGIIALLMNLKIIVDLIGAMLGLINLAVVVFFKKIYEFFQDPLKGLIKVVMFIDNIFKSVAEAIINAILPGSPVDLGRYRFDVFDEAIESGSNLVEAMQSSFMTEEQYNQYKIAKAEELKAIQDAAYAVEEEKLKLQGEIAIMESERYISMATDIDNVGSSWIKFINNTNRLIDNANKALGMRSKTTPSVVNR